MTSHQKGQLSARPNQGLQLGSTSTGLRRTGLETKRDGALYVPPTVDLTRPIPMIVSLHGAGGDAHHAIDPFHDLANHTGSILLAPESQGSTWDVILNGFGTDVYWIDEALGDVFSLYPIDPKRMAVAGFSDGASYALSLGITNGDLFSHIMAFSPGFLAPTDVKDSPPIYVSHGIHDRVLPIERCSRKIVPRLQEAGLPVTYREFDGGHTIPPEIAKEAFTWFLGGQAAEEAKASHVPSTQSGIEYT